MLTYYVNGSYLNKADALISVEDRGFNFSDGVYEVIAFNKRKLLNLNKHIIRLKKSLKGISIKKPFFNPKNKFELERKKIVKINRFFRKNSLDFTFEQFFHFANVVFVLLILQFFFASMIA